RIKKTEKLSEMTIAHFMTHASGLPPLPSLDLAMVRKLNQELDTDYGDIPLKKDQLQTYEELLTFIGKKNIDLVSDPGELFSYSNDAYALLGAIIEKVTGITYEDYVMEEIIKTCQMSQTHFLIEDYGVYAIYTSYYEYQESIDDISI